MEELPDLLSRLLWPIQHDQHVGVVDVPQLTVRQQFGEPLAVVGRHDGVAAPEHQRGPGEVGELVRRADQVGAVEFGAALLNEVLPDPSVCQAGRHPLVDNVLWDRLFRHLPEYQPLPPQPADLELAHGQ